MTILDLAIFLGFPGKSYHACTALMLAKLYSNSLFALLNSRAHLKNILDLDEPISFLQSPPISGERPSHLATGQIVFEGTQLSVATMQVRSWVEMDIVELAGKLPKLVEEM